VPRHLATPSGVVLFLVLLLCALAASPGRRAGSASLLANGGFESGTTSWTVQSDPGASCPAFSGTNALSLSAGSVLSLGLARQALGTQPAGTFTYSGYLRRLSGPVTLVVARINGMVDGVQYTQSIDVTPGETYQSFSVNLPTPGQAESVTVEVRYIAEGPTTICIDDLALEFVAAPPTETPTPTETVTAVATTGTATATQTVPVTGSATPTATSTTATSSTDNGLVFINGGFEDGIDGWSKFGGELSTSANQRLSGEAAGRLTSATQSTKWAYQPVRIDPARTYEFQGYVATDGDVSEAYLRIAWYTSDDASGSALSSIDSLSRLGSASGFAYLTTGPVAPPPDARSARLRVILAPASTSTATIFMDDFSFGTTTAPPATRTPVPEPTATLQAQVAGATATRAPREATANPSSSAEPTSTRERSTPSASPSTTATASGSSLAASGQSGAGGGTSLEGRGEEPAVAPVGGSDTPVWVYVALPAVAGLLGAGYWYSKRRQSP
jgi:hypothetical protein